MSDQLNPFSFVKDIEFAKKDLMDSEDAEKAYVPFVVNKALSYHMDCVMFGNEMNRRAFLDKKLQYHYFLDAIRSRRRLYNKWEKPEVLEDLAVIMKIYKCSRRIARTYLPLITPHELEILRDKTDLGGIK